MLVTANGTHLADGAGNSRLLANRLAAIVQYAATSAYGSVNNRAGDAVSILNEAHGLVENDRAKRGKTE